MVMMMMMHIHALCMLCIATSAACATSDGACSTSLAAQGRPGHKERRRRWKPWTQGGCDRGYQLINMGHINASMLDINLLIVMAITNQCWLIMISRG